MCSLESKTRGVLILGAVFALHVLTGCGGGEKPSDKPQKDMNPSPTRTVSLESHALYQELDKDPSGTAAKYKDAFVELKGKVVGFTNAPSDADGGPAYSAVFLEGVADSPLSVVRCVTSDPRPWAKTCTGTEAVVRGRLAADGSQLKNCEIVSGTPSPTFTAEELTKELTSNATALKEKLDGKEVFVRGTVSSNEPRLVLKGDGAVAVVIDIQSDSDRESAKVGSVGEFMGKLSVLDLEGRESVSLDFASRVDFK